MNLDSKGTVLVDTELLVDPDRLSKLAKALGTESAAETALKVPFFGPTAAGQDSVVAPLGMDLHRALQGGQSYEWHRSFIPGETVAVTVSVEDLIDKGTLQLATVLSEYRAADGELIQRQRTVFVERAETGAGVDADAGVDQSRETSTS